MHTSVEKVPAGVTRPLRLLRVETVDLPVMELLRDLDRRMHGVFCGLLDPAGCVPSEAIHDVRRHRQHPWRLTGKRMLEAIAADVAMERVELVPLELYRWMQRVAAVKGRRPYLELFQSATPTQARRISKTRRTSRARRRRAA